MLRAVTAMILTAVGVVLVLLLLVAFSGSKQGQRRAPKTEHSDSPFAELIARAGARPEPIRVPSAAGSQLTLPLAPPAAPPASNLAPRTLPTEAPRVTRALFVQRLGFLNLLEQRQVQLQTLERLLHTELRAAQRSSGKLQAIQLLRAKTGWSLAACKSFVDGLDD